MKKIVLVLVVALMGTMAMNAQPQRGRMIKERVEQLTKALNLSDEQRDQITEILKEGMSLKKDERPALKEGEKAEKPDQTNKMSRRDRFQEQRAATDAKIAKVLNPDQLEAFEQFRLNEEKQEGPRGHGPKDRQHRDRQHGDHHKMGPKNGDCCKAGDSKDCCDKPKGDKKPKTEKSE